MIDASSIKGSAIVGLKINSDGLWKKETQRTCHCKVRLIKTMKFCSKCGERAFRIVKTDPVRGYNKDENKFLDYDVVSYGFSLFICVLHCTKKRHGQNLLKFLDSFSLNKEKEKMIKLVKPYGLWDENKFGLWVCVKALESMPY